MSPDAYIKLSDLTRRIEEQIRMRFGDELFWIAAEISGHTFYPNSDRHYFSFVEKIEGKSAETAKVTGIAWTAGSARIKQFENETGQSFTNGLQVLTLVRVQFHAIHGFQLILTDIDASYTLGALERQRRETLIRLVSENPGQVERVGDAYMTRNKKLRLASVIQKIALIASPNSQGYNDFVHTIANNQFGYTFHVDEYRSSVQGELAEKELVSSLVTIYQSGIRYDAVVIVRGGGARTDFLVFDTYNVSRAVARFPMPVITGIGHHKDVSLVDLMSHTATKTPTKAAEWIIEHARSFEDGLLNAQKAIVIRSQRLVARHKQEVSLTHAILLDRSRTLIHQRQDTLRTLNETITGQAKTLLFTLRQGLMGVEQSVAKAPVERIRDLKTFLTGLNQGLIRKVLSNLNAAQNDLHHSDEKIKNGGVFILRRSEHELAATSQLISNKTTISLLNKRSEFGSVVGKISNRALITARLRKLKLNTVADNLGPHSLKYLSAKKTGLVYFQKLNDAMRPANILRKGFAMIQSGGRILNNTSSVEAGSEIVIIMNDADIKTKVITKIKKNGR